ncbi:MAG: deoxyribodipyrimidine photolyase [Gemmatimonadaceae bacterium]
MSPIPHDRIIALNEAPLASGRDMVLYWQTTARRTRSNFALQHAIDCARTLGKPLVVLEALRAGYRWASARFHHFAIDAMVDNAAAYATAGVRHYAYVEPVAGAGKGLLGSLARHACLVVTDDYPEFFLPRMAHAAAAQLGAIGVRLEAVDGNGILPMRAAGKAHVYAHQFRRHVQRLASEHLAHVPETHPLRRARALVAPSAGLARTLDDITTRWPAASTSILSGELAGLAIDHSVAPVAARGGERAAQRTLARFIDERYDRYAARRNDAIDDASSGLSPHLHWGFLSAHDVFAAVAERERWSIGKIGFRPTGRRDGWWGVSANGDAFLDQLVTWRELGFNGALYIPAHDTFDSLPPWARATLVAHDADQRPNATTLDALDAGETYDPLWNAAQGQLRAEGRIHNYLRMLWGKKILEWSPDPRTAFAWMLHLNNKWAVDGRDPNSTSGIAWVMGRYDRPWAPERPIIGVVRAMSSTNTGRKMKVRGYIERYG